MQKGEVLEESPLVWTGWELAKDYYDEARVLSRDTGFARNYDREPYGSYASTGDYYDSGNPMFRVMHTDEQIADKIVVMAGRLDRTPFAISKNKIAEEKLIRMEIHNINSRTESIAIIVDDPDVPGGTFTH